MKLSKSFLVLIIFFLVSSCAIGKVQIIEAQNARKISNDLLIKIKAGQYKEVEEYFDYLAKEKPVLKSGIRVLEEVYADLSERRNILQYYNQWCSSENPHHSAYIIRGMYHMHDAWRDRGSGYAYTISDEGYILFKEKLTLAKKDLETAYYLNPKDPNSAGEMILVLTGLKSDEKTMEDWFVKAVKADPATLRSYWCKLNYLLPKWYGTEEKAKEFALYCYNSSPKRSIVYITMLDYLIEIASHTYDAKAFLTSEPVKNTIEDIFQRWLEDYPESSYAYARKADIYKNIDRMVSFECLNKAIQLDPENIYALNMRANHYLDRENGIGIKYIKAERDSLKIIEINPDHAEAYRKLAEISIGLRYNYDKAVEYSDKAIALDDKTGRFFEERANAKMAKQNYQEALNDFESMKKLDEFNFIAYYNIGICYNNMNEFSKARESLLIARELLKQEAEKGGAGKAPKEVAKLWSEHIDHALLIGIDIITPELVRSIVERQPILMFPNVKEISPAVAEEFGKFGGILEIDGLTSISKEVAKHLSKHKGHLFLNGLRSISIDVAKYLGEHKEYVGLSGLTSMTPDVARCLVKRKGNHEYNGLESITSAVAIELCKADWLLALNGMQTISPEVARCLGNSKNSVQIDGLTSLNPNTAEELSRVGGWLMLNGIKEISDDVAEKLGKHNSGLSLNGLESISEEIAKHLKNVNGCLSLIGLKEITPEVADHLSTHQGQLVLSGLSLITFQVAEKLSKHKGDLDLSGIKTLEADIAKILSVHEEPINLSGVESITAESHDTLKKYQHIQLPHDIDDRIEEQIEVKDDAVE